MKSDMSIVERIEGSVKAFLRVRLIIFVLGGVVGVFGHTLYGFWDFRSENMAVLRQQWLGMIDAQQSFEAQLAEIDVILKGKPLAGGGRQYGEVAQKYISSIEAISRSVPEIGPEVADYIESISQLRKYYDEEAPPVPDTDEWMLFYGHFRQDFDHYVEARERYFGTLADRLGSYFRYVKNS